MINKLIVDTIASLNIPIAFQQYSGKSETYITFHEYYSNGEVYEDDLETLTSHYIQVDIWSKGDYTTLVDKVRESLILVGFKRINEIDLYEKDTKIYHKGMKFYYLEERKVD
ncbi:hypothetical protein [Clostridium tertium]